MGSHQLLLAGGSGGGGGGGGFSPSAVSSAVLKMWLDADTIVGADNDAVTTWADVSGNGNDASRLFSDPIPILKLGIVNGKKVVRFAPASSYGLLSLLPSTATQTLFIVAKAGDATQVWRVIGSSETNSIGAFDWINGNAGNWAYYFTSAGSSIGSIPGSATVWGVVTYEMATGIPYYNGTAGSAFPSNNDNIEWTIGASVRGTHPFDGDIAEVIIYEGTLSSGDRNNVVSYLRTKYAI